MLRPVLCLQQLSLDDDDHAQLQAPSHAVFMANGNLVVSETSQLRIFRETGKLLRAVDISFDGPFGIAVGENALCVADCRKNRLVALELDPQSEITRQKFSIKLQSPIAVVLHRDRAFVTEQVNHTVAICNLKTGTLERRFGGEGSGGGELWCPYGIAAYDSTLYVADSWNHRIARFSLRGEWLGAWGEAGGAPGRFRSPYGVGVAAGVLVVSEAGNKRLQLLALADGSPLWHGSPHSMHGPCGSLRMLSAEERTGRVVVADGSQNRLYLFKIVDWLQRWQAMALLWVKLCAWRQRAAARAFAPGGVGYAAVAASTLVGVESPSKSDQE